MKLLADEVTTLDQLKKLFQEALQDPTQPFLVSEALLQEAGVLVNSLHSDGLSISSPKLNAKLPDRVEVSGLAKVLNVDLSVKLVG